MKLSYIGAIVIGLSSLMSFTLSAADIDAGKTKTALCAGCHGQDGNSVNPIWPSLAGQHAKYLVKQLKEFKAGVRVNATMQGMVAALSDTDMIDISAYYESLNAKPVSFDEKLIEHGENIFRGGITDASIPACMSCHSPTAAGNGPAAFPSLKGQHPEYLVAQLKSYRDKTRANDPGKMMRNVAARMSDQEMMAVAAYIAGIR